MTSWSEIKPYGFPNDPIPKEMQCWSSVRLIFIMDEIWNCAACRSGTPIFSLVTCHLPSDFVLIYHHIFLLPRFSTVPPPHPPPPISPPPPPRPAPFLSFLSPPSSLLYPSLTFSSISIPSCRRATPGLGLFVRTHKFPSRPIRICSSKVSHNSLFSMRGGGARLFIFCIMLTISGGGICDYRLSEFDSAAGPWSGNLVRVNWKNQMRFQNLTCPLCAELEKFTTGLETPGEPISYLARCHCRFRFLF